MTCLIKTNIFTWILAQLNIQYTNIQNIFFAEKANDAEEENDADAA